VEHEDVDVVIVGAGLSGLAAARRLLAEDVGRLVVVDARDEPGGKCVWRRVGGHLVHPGPAWTGAKQDHIKALAAAYGIATYRIEVEGAKYARSGGPVVQYSETREPPLTGTQGEALERAQAELSRVCERVSPSRPWDAPDADSLDKTTAASWIRSQSSDPVVQGVLERVVKRAGADPNQMSMLSVGARIGSCGGIAGLQTDVDELFVGGVAAIPLAIAKDLGERLRLSWPVAQISWSGDGVKVTGPHGTVSAKRAIIAMSAADARQIQFSPGLSTRRERVHRGWFAVAGVKMMLVYASPFWHLASADRPAIAAVINEAGDPYTVLDQSPADGTVGVLAASLGLRAESASSSISDDVLDDPAARRRRVLDTLVRVYGAEAESPLGIDETYWDEEPFISGCHGFPQPGVLRDCGQAMRDPVGAIHWAGTETADVWINHMDGAVQSGERAAVEVSTVLATGVDSRVGGAFRLGRGL
jgi:monoamine oxidase